ncbi:MAG: hypothetical protein KAG28_00285 [Cocleimonas sp.]|nr:hypothetical protein [Cocleimonas sp.]
MSMAQKPRLLICIMLIGLFSTISAMADSPSARKSLIRSANIDANEEYTFKHCNPLRKKPFETNSKKKKLLLIGDSQACDFLNSMIENGYLTNYQIRMRYIPYQCQPLISKHLSRFIDRKDRELCADTERTDNLLQAKEQIKQANLVIFSARWKAKAAKALTETIRQLNIKSDQNVIVLGGKFFGKISIRQYLRMSDKTLLSIKNDIDDNVKESNKILRTELNRRIIYIDQYKLVCGSEKDCPVFTKNLDLISYDGWHLTKSGARYVGNKLFKNSPLREM